MGALCGEAVVFTKKAPEAHYDYGETAGALLAKGRLLGISLTLFTDDLYTRISKNAIETAMKLKSPSGKRISAFLDSPTNQQFILENKKERRTGQRSAV